MRRWLLPNLVWTIGIIVLAAILALAVSGDGTGASHCQGCPPEDSPWSGFLALFVIYFAVIALVAGNVALLVIAFIRRRRARQVDP